MSLPRKLKHPELPTNFGMARYRFCNTFEKRLQDKKLLNAYYFFIQAHVDTGLIESVTTKHIPGSNVHYSSHYAVMKDSKITFFSGFR